MCRRRSVKSVQHEAPQQRRDHRQGPGAVRRLVRSVNAYTVERKTVPRGVRGGGAMDDQWAYTSHWLEEMSAARKAGSPPSVSLDYGTRIFMTLPHFQSSAVRRAPRTGQLQAAWRPNEPLCFLHPAGNKIVQEALLRGEEARGLQLFGLGIVLMRVRSSAAVVEACRWGVLLFILITAARPTLRVYPRGGTYIGPRAAITFSASWPLAWQNA